jgi:hypothetical protein
MRYLIVFIAVVFAGLVAEDFMSGAGFWTVLIGLAIWAIMDGSYGRIPEN